jgi:hypothetical protein
MQQENFPFGECHRIAVARDALSSLQRWIILKFAGSACAPMRPAASVPVTSIILSGPGAGAAPALTTATLKEIQDRNPDNPNV